GGNAQVLCDAARMTGGSWNKDGVILFGSDFRTTLSKVSAQGSEPQLASVKSDDQVNTQHYNPYFLPDGRHFLFRADAGGEPKGIWSGSLDSAETKQLIPDGSSFVYAPQGWLLFVRNDTLFAQAFDARSITLSGEPIPIVAGQKLDSGFRRRFSVSD